MVRQRGRKFAATIAVEDADIVVVGLICGVVPMPHMWAFNIIPVLPPIPSQVMKLQKKTIGPTFAGLLAAAGVVMALLQLAPVGEEEALKQVFPANGGL